MANDVSGLVAAYPSINVRGAPYDRGVQYGRLARDRVHGSVRFYGEVFRGALDVDWGWVRERASSFADSIAAFSEDIAQEMRGLADGAEIEYEDVLSLNCRSEVLDAATVRAATGRSGRFFPECSAFVAEACATSAGSLIVGQNWDWLARSEDNVIVLSVEQDEKPNYVTVVEAGLLAKMGMNQAGVTLTTNSLICERDLGGDGLPFHVVLRALIESPTVSEGVATLQRVTRSGSGNYMLASASGLAVNVETAPGGYRDLAVEFPENGVLAHTNHFISNHFLRRSPDDYGITPLWEPSSAMRLHRLQGFLRQHNGQIDRERVQSILADHADHPSGLCSHVNLELPPHEHWATRASLIMEPADRAMWLAEGNPCAAPFRRLDTTVLAA
jgi:isopenicillin-N N-acyltransferase-like protein